MKFVITSICGCLICIVAFCQDGQTVQKMDFEKYDPISTLVVPGHPTTHSKYPFIDVHNHQWGMPTQDLSSIVKDMDAMNMKVMVNLSG